MVWKWQPITLEGLDGIEPWEVIQALSGPRRWPRPSTSVTTGLSVLTIWARTDRGRPLLVALRPLDKRDWEIMAVRELTSGQVAELEKWENDHG
jgi:hypothetical protein